MTQAFWHNSLNLTPSSGGWVNFGKQVHHNAETFSSTMTTWTNLHHTTKCHTIGPSIGISSSHKGIWKKSCEIYAFQTLLLLLSFLQSKFHILVLLATIYWLYFHFSFQFFNAKTKSASPTQRHPDHYMDLNDIHSTSLYHVTHSKVQDYRSFTYKWLANNKIKLACFLWLCTDRLFYHDHHGITFGDTRNSYF